MEYADRIGNGWEKISYKFACSFIHLSILHNWNEEDVTKIVDEKDKKIIVNYINQYHHANLDYNCTFEDIVKYSLDIFIKIKDNMEFYINKLQMM